MLMQKNKRLMIAAVLILAVFTVTVYPKDADEIDIEVLKESNPFARFTQAASAVAAPASVGETPSLLKPDLFVKTATLKFLDASNLAQTIEKMSSDWGSITADETTNSLIICDTNEVLEKIIGQIRKADRKPDQIMIEVVLVDVKLNDETEIGINWDMLEIETSTENQGHDMTSFRQSLGYTNRLTAYPSATTSNAIAEFMSVGAGSDFSILWGDIRNVIHMLQEKNNVEILASPRVMVVSGKTASIEAVEEVPYQERTETDSGAQLETTAFKEIGVKLDVTATLTDDKSILLAIESEQKVETGTSSADVPIVDARTINTSLLLEDGQLLVIGGLRRKQTQKQTEQLPILGDLPVVGEAFKSTLTTEYNSELLVILSPHIYNEKADKLTDIQYKKFKEITQRPQLTIPEVEEKEKQQKIKEAKAKEKEKKKRIKEAKRKDKKESEGLLGRMF